MSRKWDRLFFLKTKENLTAKILSNTRMKRTRKYTAKDLRQQIKSGTPLNITKDWKREQNSRKEGARLNGLSEVGKKKEKKKHEPLKFKLRTFKLHQAWIVHTLYMVFSTSTIYNSQEKKKKKCSVPYGWRNMEVLYTLTSIATRKWQKIIY